MANRHLDCESSNIPDCLNSAGWHDCPNLLLLVLAYISPQFHVQVNLFTVRFWTFYVQPFEQQISHTGHFLSQVFCFLSGVPCEPEFPDWPQIRFMLRMGSQSAAYSWVQLPGVVALPESGSTPGYYRQPCQGTQFAAMSTKLRMRMTMRMRMIPLCPDPHFTHGRPR